MHICIHTYINKCVCIYIYIYIYRSLIGCGQPLIQLLQVEAPESGRSSPKAFVDWRDAVRGARWGLDDVDLLTNIWASELTSQ